MKITHYGIWFRDRGQDTYVKEPRDNHSIYLNGKCLGDCLWAGSFGRYSINLYIIALNGIDINRNTAPGELVDDYWVFPEHYVPSESDFLELP